MINKEVEVSGIKIHYLTFGKGQPVLVLPGWGQSSECFNNFEQYSNLGVEFYILDLPGFGKSGTPDFVWNYNDYADFLEKFCKQINILNPVILGHSFGAKVGYFLAKKVNSKKFIIYSSCISGDKNLFKILNILLIKVFYFVWPNYLFYMHCKYLHPDTYENFYISEKIRAKRMLRIYMNLNFKRPIDDKSLVDTDLLIIFGKKDKISNCKFPPDLGMVKNKKFVMFENSGHFAHINETDRFVKNLTDFLESDIFS